jgi:class 3 adenylate cyclase
MKVLSFGQLRFAVLFFFVFFLLSAVGQYLFVRSQAEGILVRPLRESAYSMNKAISYQNGINIENYIDTPVDIGNYAVVLNDGTVFDILFSKNVIPPGFLPTVKCPILQDEFFERPTTISYTSGAKEPERWTLFGKRLDKGYWLFGFSQYDEIDNPEKRLREDVALLGSTLASARNVQTGKFSGDWVLIDNQGNLLQASGGIPLITDAMQVGEKSKESPHRKLGGQQYYVLYSPITDPSASQVGMVLQAADEKQTAIALKNLGGFNVSIAALSIIVFLVLAYFYNRTHEKQKQDIRAAFQHYFSPQIMEAILKEPELLKLGGQRREVTVLFSDIRSFTSIVERLAPTQLTQLMQDYFDEMTDAVLATDGIIDKFIGDALMAFWGAPIEQLDQADRAVRTAIDMTRRLKNLQKRWAENDLPTLDIGIGINLGVATIGNFGSSRRFDYTVMGDTVNAASRLESLNKEYKSHIIISESTKKQLTFRTETRDLGEITIRGKEKPFHVFEVVLE